MRLTCPNCGAQYEVPDKVIPETGRDVQCSNCGDTWYQHHPDHPPAEDAEAADAPHPGWDSPEDEPETEFAPEEPEEFEDVDFAPEEDEPEPEPEDAAEPDQVDDDEADAQADEDDDDDVVPELEEDESLPRRGLDPSVADVLREEAAREEEARAQEGGSGLETQPDLGLDDQPKDSDQRSQEARSRMARLRGLSEDGDAAPEPDHDLISRRNLLPDIDEINSSLDSESARAEAGAGPGDAVAGDIAVARKSGFNRGFMRIVLLVLILVLLYLLAPMIADKVPALAGVLSAYVDGVNAGRLWLNDMIGLGPQ